MQTHKMLSSTPGPPLDVHLYIHFTHTKVQLSSSIGTVYNEYIQKYIVEEYQRYHLRDPLFSEPIGSFPISFLTK